MSATVGGAHLLRNSRLGSHSAPFCTSPGQSGGHEAAACMVSRAGPGKPGVDKAGKPSASRRQCPWTMKWATPICDVVWLAWCVPTALEPHWRDVTGRAPDRLQVDRTATGAVCFGTQAGRRAIGRPPLSSCAPPPPWASQLREANAPCFAALERASLVTCLADLRTLQLVLDGA